jgi:hypothetical protein
LPLEPSPQAASATQASSAVARTEIVPDAMSFLPVDEHLLERCVHVSRPGETLPGSFADAPSCSGVLLACVQAAWFIPVGNAAGGEAGHMCRPAQPAWRQASAVRRRPGLWEGMRSASRQAGA